MELTKSDNGKWKPGQSGNLNGRPPGHRLDGGQAGGRRHDAGKSIELTPIADNRSPSAMVRGTRLVFGCDLVCVSTIKWLALHGAAAK